MQDEVKVCSGCGVTEQEGAVLYQIMDDDLSTRYLCDECLAISDFYAECTICALEKRLLAHPKSNLVKEICGHCR